MRTLAAIELTSRILGFSSALWATYVDTPESTKQVASVKISDQAGPFASCEGTGCEGLTRVVSNPMLPDTVGEDRLE